MQSDEITALFGCTSYFLSVTMEPVLHFEIDRISLLVVVMALKLIKN